MTDPQVPPHAPLDGKVHLERDGQIAVLRLSRPQKMNALTPTMLDQLGEHVQSLVADAESRVVLVVSDGDRAFCTGADIHAFARIDTLDVWRDWIGRGHQPLAALANLRQPSIAVLQGAAFGGGLELALACDLRVASREAMFGLPEVGIGTVPGWGGTARLTEIVGPARAKRLIFTGDPIDAATAEQWGLVDIVADPPAVRVEADHLAQRIATRGPVAVQLAKQAVTHATTGNVAVLEALTGALTAATHDRAEGINAFRDRRDPKFLGR